MRDQNIGCSICGCKVKGSLRFIPYLKDKLKWKFSSNNEVGYCQKHVKHAIKKGEN